MFLIDRICNPWYIKSIQKFKTRFYFHNISLSEKTNFIYKTLSGSLIKMDFYEATTITNKKLSFISISNWIIKRDAHESQTVNDWSTSINHYFGSREILIYSKYTEWVCVCEREKENAKKTEKRKFPIWIIKLVVYTEKQCWKKNLSLDVILGISHRVCLLLQIIIYGHLFCDAIFYISTFYVESLSIIYTHVFGILMFVFYNTKSRFFFFFFFLFSHYNKWMTYKTNYL